MTVVSEIGIKSLPNSNAPETLSQVTDRIALRAAWMTGIFVALVVFLFNLGRNPIPMLEDARSFGALALFAMIPATFVSTGITFVLGVKAWNERTKAERHRTWKLQVVPVSLAYALLIGLVGAIILQLAEQSFFGLALAQFQAVFVVAFASAPLTYWTVGEVSRMNTNRLLRLAIVIVAAGVFLAISRADDPLWWQISFSSVGTHGTITSMIFNTSLIFGGVLLLVWVPYFKSDFVILVEHGLSTPEMAKWLYRGLYALGVSIMLVGIFENQVSDFRDLIHNTAAPMMGVIVAILGFGLGKFAPGLPEDVHRTSYFLSGLLVLGVIFVAIGYFNTAGITLYGAAIAFTWLSVLATTVEHSAQELDPGAYPA